ncbi:MAG: phage tail tape measure protein [Bacteroidales bacterium]|nr:phage tail tape measure protein [Bacteroidales bacterium]
MAKEVNKRVNVWINGKEVENNVKSIRAAMVQLTNQLNKMDIGSAEYIETSKKLRDLKAIYDEHCKSLKMTNQEIENNTTSWKKNIIHWGAFAAAAQGASAAIQRFVAATQEYVDAYAKLDDAMTNVSKYTGLTREEVKQMNEEFRQMDTRTPTEKLNALAADAGRLGITSKEAIKDFVEAADIINVALGEDLGEDAVKEIGKLADMFGTTDTMGLRGAMLATGSAINTLAQSSSASERYLMDFTSRLSGAANQAKMTQAEVLGFASVLDQNKQQVEMSATAMQKLLMNMFTAPEKYARLAGVSVQEFADALKNDANEALLSFLETLHNKGGLSELAPIFKDLGLDGARASGVISVLAQKIDDVREAQNMANTAFAEGTSVIKEAAAVNGNAAAQLDKAKKAVEDAKAELGEKLVPVLTAVTNGTSGFIRALTKLPKTVGDNKALLVVFATLLSKQILLLVNNTVALTKKTLAIVKDTVVQRTNMAVTNLSTLRLYAHGLAHDIATGKIRLHIAAQEALSMVMKKTPWGFVIGMIATAVAAVKMFTAKQREAKKVTEEFNKACAQEQAEAEYLFGKLKKAEKGTKDYEEALQKLKEKYPEIIQKHIDEEGRLRNIEQAYKDVITQIQAKIALDMREKQNTDTIAKHTSEQLDLFNKLRKRLSKDYTESQVKDMMDAVQTMTKAGKDSNAIFKSLQDNYGYTHSSGLFGIVGILTALTEEQRKMTEEVEATNNQYDPFIDNLTKSEGELDEIARIDAQIADLQKQIYGAENRKDIRQQIEDLKKLKQQKLENKKADSGNSPGSSEETDPEEAERKRKKILQDRDAFEKKLAQMRTKEQTDLLTGWEKTRQQIIDKYKEMEAEAVKLYGENSQMLKDVQAQRDQAIAEAGQKYIQDMAKALDKSASEISKWQNELGKDGNSEVMNAVLGVKEKWTERANEIVNTLKGLLDTRKLMATDGLDTTAIDEQIAKLEQHLENISNLTVQEIGKTYQKYEKQTADFITAEAKAAKEATMTEVEKQKAAIQERYQLEIDKINKLIAAKLQNEVLDEAEIKSLRDKIELLKRMQAEAEAAVVKQASGGLRGKSIWQQLAEFDWSNLANNWQKGLDLMANALDDFAYSAMSIFNTINQMQSNREQAEFDSYCKMQDDKAKNLQERLNKGLISQEKYDAEIAKMEEEKEAKEKQMKHEQFERERQSSFAEVLIQGVIAVARAFADYGWPGGLIPAALSTAQTAVQTAMISSQVNPYARGGYIDREQLALMGEEGQEWVASNRLLTDKKTAPVISALESYQRGDIRALDMLRVPEPSWEKLSQSSRKLSRTFAPSAPVNNYYYTNSNNTTTSDNSELLAVMKRMDAYLRDPKNRQAVISRKMQLEFDRMETEIKQLARL